MSPLRPGSKVLGGQIPDNPWSGEPPSGELPFKDLISSVTPSPSSESRRSGLSSPLTAKRPYPPDISGLPLLPGLVETVKESVTAKPDEDATSRRGLDRPLISGSGGGLSPIGSISKMEGLNDLNAWGNKPPATIKPAIEAFAEAEDPSLASRLGHKLLTNSFLLTFSSLKSLIKNIIMTCPSFITFVIYPTSERVLADYEGADQGSKNTLFSRKSYFRKRRLPVQNCDHTC